MKKTLKAITGLLMTAQIIMSIVWIVKCVPYNVMAEDSYMFVDAAVQKLFDEYTGLLYPVFLRFLYLPFSTPYVIYAIQLVALFISIFSFVGYVKTDMGFVTKILISLYIVTFPFVLHSAFIILPDAFAISCLLLWLRFEPESSEDLTLKALLFAFASLLSKKYFWIMTLVWIIFLFVKLVKKNNIFKPLVSFVMGILIASLLAVIAITPGSYSRMPGTLSTGLMSTYAFEAFEADYTFWPPKADEVLSLSDVKYITFSRDHIITKMGPYFLDNMSYNDADKMSLGIAIASLKMRSKESIIRTIDNVTEYLIFPVTFIRSCQGDVKSITAYRLFTFEGDSPSYAVRYMYISFGILSLFFALSLYNSKYSKKVVTDGIIVWIVIAIIAGMFGFTYFDYFFVISVVIIMMSLFMASLIGDDKNVRDK